jgi:hypothetical protein
MKFKLSFIIDGYIIDAQTVSATSLKEAKAKLRAQFPGRKLTSILPD